MNNEKISKVLEILSSNKGAKTMLGRFCEKYDPFMVLISTILSARARDEVTEVIAEKLFENYPDARSLMNADKEEVIRIIRKIGFYNAKARNIIETARILVEKHDEKVPDTLTDLVKLPGVGRKVANCVLVYSFKKDAIPVDTHVHRISNRLGWIKTMRPEDSERRLEKIVPRHLWNVINEVFVVHGKTVCLPISPRCSICPIKNLCLRKKVKVSR